MNRNFMVKLPSGFSLIETVLALGLGGLILLYSKDQLTDVLRLKKLANDRFGLQLVEQDIRRAVYDKTMFALTVASNKLLAECLKPDQVDCDDGAHPIQLYMTKTRLATGSFSIPGENCQSKKTCPIQVDAEFTGLCSEGTSCDAVRSVVINYSINLHGVLYRRGLLRLENDNAQASDDAVTCPFDAENLPTFANKITPGKINCTAAPSTNNDLTGIKSGSCKANIEVLTGFAADGSLICTPIKRNL